MIANQPGVPPPDVELVTDLLRAVIDPELGADIVSLGMVPSVAVSAEGVVTVGIKLTIGGCPLRAQIKKDVESRIAVHPGVSDVRIEWGEMTADERSAVMGKARWNAREHAPDTNVPLTTKVIAVASGKGGVGKSSVTVNVAAAVAAQGFVVGVLDADIWGFSVPRLLGIEDRLEAEHVEGSEKPQIIPNSLPVGRGRLEVVSTGFLVEEGTALMWRGLMLAKAVEQFLRDVRWGALDYLFIDMPPGTGDVQMSAFTCEHGESYALFGSGGGQALADEIGVPLLGRVPIESAVSAGGDAGAPVAIAGTGAAADEFRAIARRLIDDIAPPANMAGCSARMLQMVTAALDAKPA